MLIQQDEYWKINGAEQFVAVRAEQPGLPLLLYLHGGPGDAALPLVLKYNQALARRFTLVIWEQRGAGKSYYPFAAQEEIRIDTFVQDAKTLIELLLKKFHQNALYLVGHSWGSVLGLRLCRRFPHLIHTYIGCGQVVNMKKACRIAYDYALSQASGKAARRLAQTDCAYTGAEWLEDLLFVTGQVVRHKGSLYGERSYRKLAAAVILSKEYGVRDLIRRQKGGMQSIRALWPELMDVSFESDTSYETPIVLIEGKHDYHVSSALAKEYFDTVTSEKQFYLFEHSCHFPQWSEAQRFHEVLFGLLDGR